MSARPQGKPPREHRFRRGRSGSPKGRPPKDRSPDHWMMNELLVAVANGPIKVRIGGEEREVAKRTAIAIDLINDALKRVHRCSGYVFAALDGARGGPIAEGSVGGGTGMMTFEYKAGTGTASRVLPAEQGGYTVGVLVQSNFGTRHSLRLGGIRVGERLQDDMPRPLDPDLIPPEHAGLYARWLGTDNDTRQQAPNEAGDGSIIVIVVTDAPLLPHQLKHIAKRPALGIGRLGGVGASLSGDIFLALSTANGNVSEVGAPQTIDHFPNLNLTPMFEAVVDATEEAIVNAMVAAEAMEGANRFYVPALPIERVRAILAEHGYRQ